ncbi:MAG: 50S ribosomal protein L19e [Nanoarchaeota archaeon]|nr:50S ribosomal protein L19e [Nanoarchaeota archaeon]|tara:strand:+ start:8895 stop:9347 length:453 start_codon:yes stop_codon:yes gene_type:complete
MKNKKQLAARILNVSKKKVAFAFDALKDIKKAITRSDMRGLIAVGKISKKNTREVSRVRARKIASQKRKGLQRGHGKRKGKKYSLVSKKDKWMNKVRAQRKLLKELKQWGKISPEVYTKLYRKVSGGYFRNRRHIKLYIKEYNLLHEKSS